MTSRTQQHRSTVTKARPSAGETRPGTLSVNFADKQLSVTDNTLGVDDLLAVRFFSPQAEYEVGNYVVYNGRLYRAQAHQAPGPFTLASWDEMSVTGPAGPQGLKGDKGDKGDPGAVGPAGPSGSLTAHTHAIADVTGLSAALTAAHARYLGDFSTAPSVDNSGAPLAHGDLYFNLTTNTFWIHNGTAFTEIKGGSSSGSSSSSGSAIQTNVQVNTAGWVIDGANATFLLRDSFGNVVKPGYSSGCIVVVNNVLQNPGSYTITEDKIVFATPPAAGATIWMVAGLTLAGLDTSEEPVSLVTAPVAVVEQKTRPLDYSLSAASLALGPLAANAASPNWLTNPAGTVAQNTYWTTTQTRYFEAATLSNFNFKSKYRSVDAEVDMWCGFGYTFLRLDNSGKAIVFHHNMSGGTSNRGQLQIGIVTGLNEANTTATYYWLYTNNDLTTNVSGYAKTGTDGHYFTFGVAGLDIYAKYNGVEFCRFRDYRHYKEGAAACRSAAAGYGFRQFNVRHLLSKRIYSDPSNGIIDMRDFDVRAVSAVGSMAAGSPTLTLTKKSNFKVGDYVLVETGGEVGLGARGTVGVGGVWPALSYATSTAMQADLTKAANTFAWAQDTGSVWQFVNGAWVQRSSVLYYSNAAIPLGLQARVNGISSDGLTLTLDTPASAATVNANVHLNVLPMLHIVLGRQYSTPGITPNDYRPITPTGMTVRLPPGRLAICGTLSFIEKTKWRLKGNGSELFSPKGFTGASIWVSSCSRCVVSKVDVTGNCGDSGFALDNIPALQWGGYRADGLINAVPSAPSVTQVDVPSGIGYPRGISMVSSTGCRVYDCLVTNVFFGAVHMQYANDCWAYRVTNKQIHLNHYVQWQVQIADSDNCGAVDCTVDADQVIAGFEAFKSTNIAFDRCKALNATWSLNNAGNVAIINPYVRITGQLSGSFVPQNSLIAINSNIGVDRVALGATVINPMLTQDVYVTANNDSMIGIVVNASNPNVSVLGGFYKAPDYSATSTQNGSVGINATGQNFLVDGFRVYGTAKPGGLKNINATSSNKSSRADNCFAGSIAADNLPAATSAAVVMPPIDLNTGGAGYRQPSVDFGNIPAGVSVIEIAFKDVSVVDTSSVSVQLGTAAALETAGYLGGISNFSWTANNANGFILPNSNAGAGVTGIMRLYRVGAGSFTFVCEFNGVLITSGQTTPGMASLASGAGSKALAAELTRIRITTNGAPATALFDAGTVSVTYS